MGSSQRPGRDGLLTLQSEMRQEGKSVSLVKLCTWFGVSRSTVYYTTRRRGPVAIDAALTTCVREIIEANPTFGVRRITVVLRRRVNRQINRKTVHRIVKHHGWQVWQKPQGKRPRVAAWPSRASTPNARWAIDTTHLFTSREGWCHLTAIIDCCDRTIVGWRLSRSGIARVAASALEDALRDRRIDSTTNLSLRSDNGLVFGAKAFVRVARRYGVSQEYITPYSPEQNGMIERFFKTLKEECVWLHRFRDRDHAFAVIAAWLERYDAERPHSALGYLTPKEYREKLAA